jgi:hypothetical protein
MIRLPSIVFGDAELAIDLVLLFREYEQLDYEHDQCALGGHVEAEGKFEDGYGDLVERDDEHLDDIAEEEPDPEMQEHQVGRPSPVFFVVGSIGWRHGVVTLPLVGSPQGEPDADILGMPRISCVGGPSAVAPAPAHAAGCEAMEKGIIATSAVLIRLSD